MDKGNEKRNLGWICAVIVHTLFADIANRHFTRWSKRRQKSTEDYKLESRRIGRRCVWEREKDGQKVSESWNPRKRVPQFSKLFSSLRLRRKWWGDGAKIDCWGELYSAWREKKEEVVRGSDKNMWQVKKQQKIAHKLEFVRGAHLGNNKSMGEFHATEVNETMCNLWTVS